MNKKLKQDLDAFLQASVWDRSYKEQEIVCNPNMNFEELLKYLKRRYKFTACENAEQVHKWKYLLQDVAKRKPITITDGLRLTRTYDYCVAQLLFDWDFLYDLLVVDPYEKLAQCDQLNVLEEINVHIEKAARNSKNFKQPGYRTLNSLVELYSKLLLRVKKEGNEHLRFFSSLVWSALRKSLDQYPREARALHKLKPQILTSTHIIKLLCKDKVAHK